MPREEERSAQVDLERQVEVLLRALLELDLGPDRGAIDEQVDAAELLVVLGTASSDSVLPQVMKKLEFMGIKKSVVGLVIPTGYSFNLDAFSIYLTLAAVFIAQATNTPLAMADLLGILAVALVTSKGAHGIPGSAIVILAATLSAAMPG